MTRSQLKLLALLVFFAAPALAAWLSYAYWPPQQRHYGDLLTPAPLDLPALTDPAGQTRNWSELRGKWVLLVVNTSDCDASCARATFLARQVRLAQGREQERIERVFLGPRAASDWPYREGVYRAAPPQAAALSQTALPQTGLYLVDPLGNLMLRFPDTPDGGLMIRDLRRLLQASRIG
jgi:cytochrome oxidase Cu insertion factor (SCO1/SenC/PrrC family)